MHNLGKSSPRSITVFGFLIYSFSCLQWRVLSSWCQRNRSVLGEWMEARTIKYTADETGEWLGNVVQVLCKLQSS